MSLPGVERHLFFRLFGGNVSPDRGSIHLQFINFRALRKSGMRNMQTKSGGNQRLAGRISNRELVPKIAP